LNSQWTSDWGGSSRAGTLQASLTCYLHMNSRMNTNTGISELKITPPPKKLKNRSYAFLSLSFLLGKFPTQ